MSGLEKEKEKKGSGGSGLLSTLLLAGGAAAIGYLAHKLQTEYEEQAQGAAPPTNWSEEADTRRKQNRDKTADKDLPDCVKCIVCMENSREVILVPCGHMCLCEDCSMKLLNDKCPVCKRRIEDKKIAYLP